jgi:hypothetical protein
MEWGECVSQVTAVQRQLREKQAWLQMLRALQPTNWSTNISPVVDDIVAAHESYMECWVNAASEKLIHWFLYLNIPCFVLWCRRMTGSLKREQLCLVSRCSVLYDLLTRALQSLS